MASELPTTKNGDGNFTTATVLASPKAKAGPVAAAVLDKFHMRAPNSTQLIGFFTLLVSGSILLLLTGLTSTGIFLALLTITPVVLLTSPIWVPMATVSLVVVTGLLLVCGFIAATLVGGNQAYKHFHRRRCSSSSERSNYSHGRFTSNHFKDSGGSPHERVKDTLGA